MANANYQDPSRGVICNPNEDIAALWTPNQPSDPANGRFSVRCSDPASPTTQIRIRFRDVRLTVTDSLAYAGLNIGTLNASLLSYHSVQTAFSNLVISKGTHGTGTSTGIDDNATTVTFGVGTATATNVTLATTMQNILPVTTVKTTETGSTAGWTQSGSNYVSYARVGALPALGINSATPSIFFNIGITTGTDIDADTVLTINGELVLNVQSIGANNSTNN
jgi:hypothetical protein